MSATLRPRSPMAVSFDPNLTTDFRNRGDFTGLRVAVLGHAEESERWFLTHWRGIRDKSYVTPNHVTAILEPRLIAGNSRLPQLIEPDAANPSRLQMTLQWGWFFEQMGLHSPAAATLVLDTLITPSMWKKDDRVHPDTPSDPHSVSFLEASVQGTADKVYFKIYADRASVASLSNRVWSYHIRQIDVTFQTDVYWRIYNKMVTGVTTITAEQAPK